MILAVFGAVVKQKFTRKEPYGIDINHTYKLFSPLSKVNKRRMDNIAVVAQG